MFAALLETFAALLETFAALLELGCADDPKAGGGLARLFTTYCE